PRQHSPDAASEHPTAPPIPAHQRPDLCRRLSHRKKTDRIPKARDTTEPRLAPDITGKENTGGPTVTVPGTAILLFSPAAAPRPTEPIHEETRADRAAESAATPPPTVGTTGTA